VVGGVAYIGLNKRHKFKTHVAKKRCVNVITFDLKINSAVIATWF